MADSAQVAQVEIAGKQLPVERFGEFHEQDVRRATSFVTNFGNWWLPAGLAGALGVQRGRLEWIHDTGDLVLLGGLPQLGWADVEVPRGEGLSDAMPEVFGGPGAVIGPGSAPGVVRESFEEEQLPADARVVLIAKIAHGPRVHELLWGWHEHHRDRDGWRWLLERLSAIEKEGGEDRRFV